MAQPYSSIALACTCQFGPGTIAVLWYKACKSLVEAAERISPQVVMALEGRCSVLHFNELNSFEHPILLNTLLCVEMLPTSRCP